MARGTGTTKVLATIIAIVGAVMIVAGGVTYYVVHSQLADEKITVSDDADFLAGDKVDGPFSAYAQAEVIQKHALKATGGKTYAELAQDDPLRQTAMQASFLRASLFTSVVAFGVAAMAIGLGVVLILVGWALMPARRTAVAAEPGPEPVVET
ncbi:aromatic ring-opening dioxygenase LigA [Nocardioides sp. CER19]|uniref:aromatic ring-opening dioxygenase LigA n=1 Tax=Nocardioides sp. CER19 TaxID=3038538 RepID=UPI0024477A71|nr:aromatic ring-opening dioxygenase LigA [Nocardioides sp. CER19]MDH2414999.1 aromatic ring-opening dioxygenase LigA [Nocardioides sp. CER19]